MNDPATANTGVGPRPYDDRGAYEYTGDEPNDQAPSASLVVTPSSGAAPLQVTADGSGSTDTDATPIATYRFDFGDGTTVGPQAGPTAAHTYAAAGTYTTRLTVTDTAGLASSTTAQVTVASGDAPPAAALTVSPGSGVAPLQVTADASGSTDTDATPIATYRFDFGDGTIVGPQAGATANHTYTTAGTYTARVTVTDTAGLSSSATAQVTVNPADAAPAAALTVSPSSGVAPLQVTADASGSTDTDATPIATYRFDFGDGTIVGPQAGATATHSYTATGTFTVTVTVTDTAGLSSTATSQVTVTANDNPPAADITVSPSSGVAPLQVTADASGSTDTDATPIATYRFDFGDGTIVWTTGRRNRQPHLHHCRHLHGTGNRHRHGWLVVVGHRPGHRQSGRCGAGCSADGLPQLGRGAVAGDGRCLRVDRYRCHADRDLPVRLRRRHHRGTAGGATATHSYTATGTFTVTVTVTDTAGLVDCDLPGHRQSG